MIPILFLLFFGLPVAPVSATTYDVSTGPAVLRIDDTNPGGFVWHDWKDATEDNLWLSFLVLSTDAWTEPIHARAQDASVDGADSLAANDFRTIDSLTMQVDTFRTDTLLDSIRTAGSLTFVTPDSTLAITERVSAVASAESTGYIRVDFVFRPTVNAVSGLKAILAYDADIPAPDFADDHAAYDSTLGIVYGWDVVDSATLPRTLQTGMALLGGRMGVPFSFSNWFATARVDSQLIPWFYRGGFDTLTGDIGFGWLTDLGSLLPGDSVVVRYAYVAADTAGALRRYVLMARGEWVGVAQHSLLREQTARIAPNPLVSGQSVTLSGGRGALSLRDLAGRTVWQRDWAEGNLTLGGSEWGALTPGLYLLEWGNRTLRVAILAKDR